MRNSCYLCEKIINMFKEKERPLQLGDKLQFPAFVNEYTEIVGFTKKANGKTLSGYIVNKKGYMRNNEWYYRVVGGGGFLEYKLIGDARSEVQAPKGE